MTRWLGLSMLIVAATFAGAQDPPPKLLSTRFGIEFNPINYPQKTPQDTIKSVAKALDAGRFDYMMAHLVDPKYVDPRVEEYLAIIVPRAEIKAEEDDIAQEVDTLTRRKKIAAKEKKDKARQVVAFNRLVVETRKNFEEDPVLVKELRLFAKSGEFETDEDRSSGSLKGVTTRKVFMRKKEDRWFMEERYQ